MRKKEGGSSRPLGPLDPSARFLIRQIELIQKIGTQKVKKYVPIRSLKGPFSDQCLRTYLRTDN